MELDWSEQSPHIRTLFRPWQPGDGYDEATIQVAEARLGLRLPAPLRTLYRAWGRRQDLTESYNGLLHPEQLALGEATLAFCVENQEACYWGVRREALTEENPPVVKTDTLGSTWKVTLELDWTPSHAHLSDFLDDLTYKHAFYGGALHGGSTDLYSPDLPAHNIAWLEEYWSKATVTTLVFGFDTDSPPTLYVRDGQAFWESPGCSMAAREAEALDEIGQWFQLTWKHRW